MVKVVKGGDLQELYDREELVKSYEKARFLSLMGRLVNSTELEILNNHIKRHNPKKVLEIAIGSGRLAKEITSIESGIGIDTSKSMLEYAKKQEYKSKWEFIKANAIKLPFKNNSFDLVYTFRLLRHFKKDEREKTYKEIYRIMKEDSVLIFDVINKDRGKIGKLLENFYYFYVKAVKKVKGEIFERVYDVDFSLEEVKEELSKNKLKLVRAYGVVYNYSLVYLLDTILHSLSKLRLNKLEKKLNSTLFNGFKNKGGKIRKSFQLVIIAKK